MHEARIDRYTRHSVRNDKRREYGVWQKREKKKIAHPTALTHIAAADASVSSHNPFALCPLKHIKTKMRMLCYTRIIQETLNILSRNCNKNGNYKKMYKEKKIFPVHMCKINEIVTWKTRHLFCFLRYIEKLPSQGNQGIHTQIYCTQHIFFTRLRIW